MTAQTQPSAVEALRDALYAVSDAAEYMDYDPDSRFGDAMRKVDAALAASQEAPKAGDTPEIIEGATYFTKDGRTVSAWRITADDGVYCSDLRYHCASELSLTPPASQEAPKAGDWVLVPREATSQMIDAWNRTGPTAEDAYRAMLAAAPTPPASQSAKGDAAPAGDAVRDLEVLREMRRTSYVYACQAPTKTNEEFYRERVATLDRVIAALAAAPAPAVGRLGGCYCGNWRREGSHSMDECGISRGCEHIGSAPAATGRGNVIDHPRKPPHDETALSEDAQVAAREADAVLGAPAVREAVAWAMPIIADRDVEGFDKGDLVDVVMRFQRDRPEGIGWRPLVFGDTPPTHPREPVAGDAVRVLEDCITDEKAEWTGDLREAAWRALDDVRHRFIVALAARTKDTHP